MDLIQEIKARADIIQIISAHVPLKKAGKDYKARCPFHAEKTPSFTVSAEKQLFYCFGCGTGGDLIKFVTLIEKIDIKEAIRRLADRLNIERPRGRDAAAPAEPLRRALDLAARYFEAALQAPVGAPARAYLAKRKMPDAMAKSFRIGYAPDRPDALTKRLLEKGVPEQILIDAGLTAKSTEGGTGLRDRFRDRLMFPIVDGAGHVVGFGGRVIREGDRRPKYLNSAENELFHKGKLLYGYHTAKQTVSGDSPPVLVEGYLDVMYAQSAGLSAMAALGTALTDTQADLLSRFRLRVLLAYDADPAGRKAAFRSAGLLLARDVEVGILEFPDGRDPAEMVEREESERLLEIASHPWDVFKFLVDSALAMNPAGDVGRRAAGQLLKDIGASLRDEMFRQRLISAVSDGLGLAPRAAAQMIGQSAPSGSSKDPDRSTVSDRTTAMLLGEGQSKLDWTVIGVVLARADLMAVAYAQIEDDFSDPQARLVWDALAAQYERRHEIDPEEIAAAFADNPAVMDRLTQVRMRMMLETKLNAAGFKDLLQRLRRAHLRQKIDALHARLKSAEAGRRKEEIKQLLEEDRVLQNLLSSI